MCCCFSEQLLPVHKMLATSRLLQDLPVHEILSTPGPKYSTMAPVPPLTVRMPATFKMTSLGEVHLFILPVSLTPMTCREGQGKVSDGHERGQLQVNKWQESRHAKALMEQRESRWL